MGRSLITIVCYNEIRTIEDILRRTRTALTTLNEQFPEEQFEVAVVDDASNDGSERLIRDLANAYGYIAVRNPTNSGVGYSLWQGFKQARERGCDKVVIIAGNGKMSPEQIPTVVGPLIRNECDFVQGSRYLTGGGHKMPLFRLGGTLLFTFLVNLFMWAKLSDTTCGFRAYRMKIVDDPRINVNQEWLFRYEMEFYLLFYALKLGYRVAEAPVTMLYPHKKNYSKIKPFSGWWSMIRPWVLLYSGVRK